MKKAFGKKRAAVLAACAAVVMSSMTGFAAEKRSGRNHCAGYVFADNHL